MVLKISQKSLLKHRVLGPTPSVSDSVVSDLWDLRVFISKKFPGDIDAAAGLGNTLLERVYQPTNPRGKGSTLRIDYCYLQML